MVPNTAEEIFRESVREVAIERLAQLAPELGLAPPTHTAGSRAREMLRNGHGTSVPAANTAFNLLRSRDPDGAARLAVEVAAAPMFRDLARSLSPSNAETLELAFVGSILIAVDDSIVPAIKQLIDEPLATQKTALGAGPIPSESNAMGLI